MIALRNQTGISSLVYWEIRAIDLCISTRFFISLFKFLTKTDFGTSLIRQFNPLECMEFRLFANDFSEEIHLKNYVKLIIIIALWKNAGHNSETRLSLGHGHGRICF